MKYEDMSSTLRNSLGTHEGYRRLGFNSDEIFLLVGQNGRDNGRQCAFLILRTQGKEFIMECGTVKDEDKFLEEWRVAAIAINEGRVSDRALEKIWEESAACKSAFQFLSAILRKGIVIPNLSKEARQTLN